MKRLALLLCLVAPPAFADTEFYLVEDLAQTADHVPVRAQAHELALIYDDIARVAINRLLDEIEKASELCSTSFQSMLLTLMALGDKDVNAIVLGRLADYSIWTLRLLKKFFNVEFKFKDHVKENSTTNYVIASCVGCKLKNRTTELN